LKVLLISHPNEHRQKPDFPPLGIAYLGVAARSKGHEVLLVDGYLADLEEIARQARNFAADFIGVTCWTINRGMVWKLCQILKKVLHSLGKYAHKRPLTNFRNL
jgi:hypothetical protein